MLLLALAGVASEQQQIAALQQQVAAQQAQMAALQAQVAALLQNAASTAAAQPAAAPGAAAGRALSESPGDIATSIVIGTDGAQVELGNDVSGNILLRPAMTKAVAVNGSLTVSGSPHPMFQKLRAMKKQAAYGLGQSQIAANEAISGVKTDPSELKDEFKPGAA